jgi:hypothetical protein
MDKSASTVLRVYKGLSTFVKFASYIITVSCIFGAWAVLFGNNSGKVSPEDWARARIWSVIISFVCIGVSLGIMPVLDKTITKRFGTRPEDHMSQEA